MNNLYLNRANTRTNPNSTVNNSSPSDEEIDNDDDDVDVAERGLLMTKRTYSIKNILNSFNLDNRQTSSLNMFCCGDNVVDVGQSRKKLLPSRHGPGQVVQVVTTEKGMEVSTELQSNVDGRDASDAKKKRRTDAVNV